MTDSYTLRPGTPTPAQFVELRRAGGLTPYSLDAAAKGLRGTVHGVVVTQGGTPVDPVAARGPIRLALRR